ncbi:MAG: sortase [Actinomycetota bacterium]|nr:sortase [Actinomycetota bacterium]
MDKKQNKRRRVRRQVQAKRHRTGLIVFLGLAFLAVGAGVFFGPGLPSETSNKLVGLVSDPIVDSAPEIVEEPVEESATEESATEESATEESATEESATEDEVADEDEISDEELDSSKDGENDPSVTPPSDPTMFLSIPKIGVNGAVVADGEVGLELGAQHLEGTGFPWIPDSNTYIAGHRIGFPGTGSDRIFYSLPSMSAGDEVILSDSLGREYKYQVSNVFAVTPFDTWVAGPTGDDMVTLQVCTETPDDWWTIGPSLMSSGPESGRLIVQAKKVA